MIRGYDQGANISLLNVIYHKPKKDIETGKYSTGSIDIIFKDLDTGEKKVQHIKDPKYTYYVAKDEFVPNYNLLYIEKEKTYPVTCKYRDLKKSIAEVTNNLNWYYDNLTNGNARANDQLFTIPSIFNADMNIEDYYRFQFSRMYKNDVFPIHLLYFDIEVDGINQRGDFPELGECPVNAITLIDDKGKNVYTLLLENPSNPLIEEFKHRNGIIQELKDFVRDKVGGWKNEIRYGLDKFKYNILFYEEEIQLIHAAFNIINTLKPDFALAWNIAFDLPYLIERIKKLGYNPEDIICHPDFEEKEAWYFVDPRADKFEERGDYSQVSSYTVYIDQLITFASRRKGQRQLSGFKLDYIGEKIAKVRKLDYSHITTDIAKLPYLDYYTFVFYNIMDTIVQKCIEMKVKDIDFLFNKSMMNNTRYSKAHRQTVYLINRGISEFDKKGLIMGCNVNKSNEKVGFAGAFVADPKNVSDKPKVKINGNPINICDNANDFDYKALYPSEIDENNMSAPTMLAKIIFNEPITKVENKFNNNYYDRSVWFIEDYISGNRLDFCNRYMNFGTYSEVYNDIIEYFTKVKDPIRGLQYYDSIDGMRYLCRKVVDNKAGRVIAKVVDNTQPRIIATVQERMPEYANTNR